MSAVEKFVGRKVAKEFPGYGSRKYIGVVKFSKVINGAVLHRILYEDGDSEDIGSKELLKVLVDEAAGATGKKRKAPAAAAKKEVAKEKKPEKKPRKVAAPIGKRGQQKSRKLSREEERPAAPSMEREEEEAAAEDELAEEEAGTPAAKASAPSPQPSPAAVASARAQVSALLGGKAKGAGKSPASPAAAAAATQPPQGGRDETPEIDISDAQPGIRRPAAVAPVAAGGADLRRFPRAESTDDVKAFPTDRVKASGAVAAGGFLYVSDIVRATKLFDQEEVNTPPQYYREQSVVVLAELAELLERAGAGKGSLVSVDVKLKDAEIGYRPFGKAWAEWLGEVAPPAVSIKESFLGDNSKLVAISAIAKIL